LVGINTPLIPLLAIARLLLWSLVGIGIGITLNTHILSHIVTAIVVGMAATAALNNIIVGHLLVVTSLALALAITALILVITLLALAILRHYHYAITWLVTHWLVILRHWHWLVGHYGIVITSLAALLLVLVGYTPLALILILSWHCHVILLLRLVIGIGSLVIGIKAILPP